MFGLDLSDIFILIRMFGVLDYFIALTSIVIIILLIILIRKKHTKGP